MENARSIIRDGWQVGSGNAMGDGIYLALDFGTAKSHAGTGGVYLKCRVQLGKTTRWEKAIQHRYASWCQSRGVVQNGSSITAFLLQHGYDTLQKGNVIVLLAPQYANPSAWKKRNRRITILSVHRAADGRRVRV